jgi:hypothetical protein
MRRFGINVTIVQERIIFPPKTIIAKRFSIKRFSDPATPRFSWAGQIFPPTGPFWQNSRKDPI